MFKLFEEIYLTIYLAVNFMAVIILLVAFRYPKFSRVLLSIIFLWGAFAILKTSFESPDDVLALEAPAIDLYRTLILGWFGEHVQMLGVFIATVHLVVGIMLFLKGSIYKAGVIVGAIFLILLSPLGLGSAFPCSLILACAMFVLFKDSNAFLWEAFHYHHGPKISQSLTAVD